MGTTGAGIGSIILGLLIVLAMAALIYAFGALIVARMRRGRVEEESAVTFPNQPQSEDDRRELNEVRRREREADDDIVGGEELRERTVGEGMRPVRQSPTRTERPVDANHDRGVAPRPKGDSSEGGDRNPL